MRSPLLDAFKSLDEVTDEVVAKEKRIIKESLEDSDYKEDEDIVEIDNTPIENTFTASNLYEGLDTVDEVEELTEEILDEKLPKDLGRVYRRLNGEGQRRVGFSGDDRRQSEIDYEKAEYKEITPEEAIQARKDGRIQDLRILKDDQLITYREDGYPLMGIEYVDLKDAFTNRNGKEIRDTRLMPPSHVFKIADKIYLTNEREHRFPYGKWVDGEYHYDDPTQQARVQQQKDLIPDTGKHKKVSRDYKGNIKIEYGTPEYDEQKAKEYLKDVAKYEKQLSELEDKWEEGDISKKDYESKKANIEEYINRYKRYAEEAKRDAIRRRGSIANYAADQRFALAEKELRKNIEKYKELKRSINSAQWDLDYLKRQGGLGSWSLKGGSYEDKVKEINSLKARMAEIQKQIEKLEAEATDELKQSNLDQNTKALNDAQKKVDDFKAELDNLLGRAHKASGKEESLNEAMVNLNDLEEVEEVKEERDEEKKEQPIEQIVDPNATIVDELEPSYVGKAILECTKCLGHHYMDPKDLELSEEVTPEGDKIYNLDFECPTCHAKEGYLLVGQVAELPEEGKEESEPEEENNAPKILKPEEEPVKEESVEVEETEEVKEEEKFEESLTDFDEVSFDSHMTKYLTEVYSNVESYVSTSGSNTDNGIIIEGLIKFKSGKEKPTTFKLSLEGNKMNGLNEAFSEDGNIYTIEGKIENNSFITENIIYKYNIENELIEGCTKLDEWEETFRIVKFTNREDGSSISIRLDKDGYEVVDTSVGSVVGPTHTKVNDTEYEVEYVEGRRGEDYLKVYSLDKKTGEPQKDFPFIFECLKEDNN